MVVPEKPAQPWYHARWLRQVGITLFLLVVLALLVHAAQKVPWDKVGQALRDTPPWKVAAALGFSALSYATYAAFDVLSARATGQDVKPTVAMRIATLSFGINQNLGYMVGGLALRLNLYTAQGLKPAGVAALAGSSALTNWLGHFALFGAMLVFTDRPLPELWGVDPGVWRMAGGVGLALVAVYLLLCALVTQRHWEWRHLTLELPRLPQALLQLGLGALHWGFTAAIVWVAMPTGTSFGAVTTALLVAAVAGAMAHVPAGVGVYEAVFVALLGHQWPLQQIIAALLVFRAAFQWVPGALSAIAVLAAQRRAKKS